MKVKYEVANLARCVQFLVGLVEQAEVRLSKRDRELIEMANAAAEEGLLYETELNPELLLAEYQQTFNAARDMLKVWAPEYYPWPGTPEDSPKASKRIRKTAAKQLPSGST